MPEATIYRLSLYHCYLGEALRTGQEGRITSRKLAEDLSIKDETVRRDLSFVGGVGTPGSGYDSRELFMAVQKLLGLSDRYPVVRIGSVKMIEALEVVFPPDAYGITPMAYYSELPEDVGKIVDGIEVKHISALPDLDRGLEISVALVACSPGWVQLTVDLLAKAGITGVLLLTPALKLEKPEGMTITHVRMPCDIKSLACRCQLSYGA